MKLNDYITLLFDADGNVAAAYPKKDVSAEMQGIVTKIGEGKATVTLTNGLTLRDIPDYAVNRSDFWSRILRCVLGRLVTVSQSGEGADLIRRTLSGKTAGNWSVAEGKLGSNAVSSKVRVYEEVLSGAPLNAINVSDIDLTSVPASQIKYTVQDNAGTVTNIVLGDVTGESWIYGIGYGKRDKTDKENGNSPEYVVLRHWDGAKAGGKHIPCTHAAARSGRCTDCSPQRVLNRCKHRQYLTGYAQADIDRHGKVVCI